VTPAEIIAKNIKTVKDIRIPFVRILTEKILTELKDHGYVIMEQAALNELFKVKK